MPNNYLSVLYKHRPIIQVKNKNVGLKVGRHKHTIALPPPIKKVGGGHMTPLPLPTPVTLLDEMYLIYLLSIIKVPFYRNTNISVFKNKTKMHTIYTTFCDLCTGYTRPMSVGYTH